MAARFKVSVYGQSLPRDVLSNPTGGHVCLSPVRILCCQTEVSASCWSLVQRSPTECRVSECERGTSKMMTPKSLMGVEPLQNLNFDCRWRNFQLYVFFCHLSVFFPLFSWIILTSLLHSDSIKWDVNFRSSTFWSSGLQITHVLFNVIK